MALARAGRLTMAERLATKPMTRLCPQLHPRPGWHGPCHEGHARCVKAARRYEAQERARKRAVRLALDGLGHLEERKIA